MKKLSCLIAVIAVLFVPFSTLQAKPIVIKFSHIVAENTPKGQMAIRFTELVADRLEGKVLVEVYPNGQLFGDNKVLEAMLLGDVQLAAPSLSKFKSYTQTLQLYDLPFLFKDMTAVDTFQNSDAGQGMLTAVESKGIVGLGYLHNGMKQLSSSKALKAPSDAQKLKFRIMSSDVIAAQFEAVGAIPLKTPYSEAFTLLQTKAVDGQENTWSNIYSKKFFEVQPFITESNHGVLDYMVVSSAEFWNGLPDDIRIEVKKALDEAIVFGNQVALEKAESDKQAIAASGRTEILTLTDEERQKWIDTMKPVWSQFEDEIGSDLLKAAIDSSSK